MVDGCLSVKTGTFGCRLVELSLKLHIRNKGRRSPGKDGEGSQEKGEKNILKNPLTHKLAYVNIHTQGDGNPSKGGVANEHNRNDCVVYARTYGYFSGNPDKEITAPRTQREAAISPIFG